MRLSLLLLAFSLLLLPEAARAQADRTAQEPQAETVLPAASTAPAGQGIALPARLTLEEAVQLALDNNPEIAAAQWEQQAAEAQFDAAQASRWPRITAEAGTQHFNDRQRLIPARYNGEPGDFDRDITRGDLVLTFPLFTGGRIGSEIDAANWLKQAQGKALARTREELVFAVSSAFYTLLGQREVVRSLEFSIRAMEEQGRQVEALLAAQKAARVDWLRMEVRLADLRQALVRERNMLALGKRMIMTLLGQDGATQQFSVEGVLAPPADSVPDARTLASAALQARADYQAAKARMEAQAKTVDAAAAARWPSLALQSSYGTRATGHGQSEEVGVIGLAVSAPVFDAGRIAAQERKERALLGTLQARLRKLELQISQEVEAAALDLQSGLERIKATEYAIAQAQETLRIERLKFDLGSGSVTDVLDAQAATLQSDTNHFRALADYHIAQARLRLAAGDSAL